MVDNNNSQKKRKVWVAVVAVSSIAVILFLCIFSLYHLPERDPVETPEVAENAEYVESPASDFQETNDIMSSSQQEVAEMLGELEMQYENDKVNGDSYAAQQAGFRLAFAYWKCGQIQQSKDLLETLMEDFSYDDTFVSKCQELLKIVTTTNPQ